MLQRLIPLLLGLTAFAASCSLVVESDKFKVHDHSAGGSAGAGGTTTTTGSGGALVPDCTTAADCNGCQVCMVGPGAPCEAAFAACNANPECAAILACVVPPQCTGTPQDCYYSCGLAHPSGVSNVLTLATCAYCGQCAALCAAYTGLCS